MANELTRELTQIDAASDRPRRLASIQVSPLKGDTWNELTQPLAASFLAGLAPRIDAFIDAELTR
jgi:hypothetical protein